MNIIESLKTIFGEATQAEIALEIGVTQVAVHKWMTGKLRPSARNAMIIARKKGIDPSCIRPDVFRPAMPNQPEPVQVEDRAA